MLTFKELDRNLRWAQKGLGLTFEQLDHSLRMGTSHRHRDSVDCGRCEAPDSTYLIDTPAGPLYLCWRCYREHEGLPRNPPGDIELTR